MANEIVITETDGPRRSVTLRGRSMPRVEDSPVEFGVLQRGKVNYPPMNPVADVALIGAVWQPTEIQGIWDDRDMFRDENAPTLVGFTPLAGPQVPNSLRNNGSKSSGIVASSGSRARQAMQLVEAFYLLLRSSQELTFQWHTIWRTAILREFTPAIVRPERVEWRMRFEWTGDTPQKPKVKPRPRIEARGLLQLLKDFAARIAAAFGLLALPGRLYTSLILAPFNALSQAIADLLNMLTRIVTSAFLPQRLVLDLRALYTRVRLAAIDLKNACGRIADFGEPLNQREADTIALQILNLRKEAQEMANEMRRRELALAALESKDVVASVITSTGQTLRHIAAEYYGNANDWLTIAEYNGFATSTVPESTLVLVPSK